MTCARRYVLHSARGRAPTGTSVQVLQAEPMLHRQQLRDTRTGVRRIVHYGVFQALSFNCVFKVGVGGVPVRCDGDANNGWCLAGALFEDATVEEPREIMQLLQRSVERTPRGVIASRESDAVDVLPETTSNFMNVAPLVAGTPIGMSTPFIEHTPSLVDAPIVPPRSSATASFPTLMTSRVATIPGKPSPEEFAAAVTGASTGASSSLGSVAAPALSAPGAPAPVRGLATAAGTSSAALALTFASPTISLATPPVLPESEAPATAAANVAESAADTDMTSFSQTEVAVQAAKVVEKTQAAFRGSGTAQLRSLVAPGSNASATSSRSALGAVTTGKGEPRSNLAMSAKAALALGLLTFWLALACVVLVQAPCYAHWRRWSRFRACQYKVRLVRDVVVRKRGSVPLCPYCIELIPSYSSARKVVFMCGHAFHTACANKWEQSGGQDTKTAGGCPICSCAVDCAAAAAFDLALGPQAGAAAAAAFVASAAARGGCDCCKEMTCLDVAKAMTESRPPIAEENVRPPGYDESQAFILGSLHRQFPEIVPASVMRQSAARSADVWLSELCCPTYGQILQDVDSQ